MRIQQKKTESNGTTEQSVGISFNFVDEIG